MFESFREFLFQRVLLPVPQKYERFQFFQSEEENRRFMRDGYLVTDVADGQVLNELEQEYARLRPQLVPEAPDNGFLNTSVLSNTDTAKEVEHLLLKYADRLFKNVWQKQVSVQPGSFFVKLPNRNSEVDIHQDLSHLNEREKCGIHAWVPFQDMDVENGTMHVLPGSHRLKMFERVRSMPGLDKYKDTMRQYLRPINLKRGQILFYDHSLIHYSSPNRSDRERLVASYSITEGPYQFIYLAPSAESQKYLDVYEVDRTFWVDPRPAGKKLKGQEPVDRIKPSNPLATKRRLFLLLRWLKKKKTRLLNMVNFL